MAEDKPLKTIFNSPADVEVFHPLEQEWTLWFDDPSQLPTNPSSDDWLNNLKEVFTFKTVEHFWAMYNKMVGIEKLDGCNLHLFVKGIRPTWEDPQNKPGGKWVLMAKQPLNSKEMWLKTMLLMIGNNFGEYQKQICGAVLNRRPRGDKLNMWTRDAKDETANKSIGKKWKAEIAVPTGMKIEYQSHEKSLETGSSYATASTYTV